MKIPDNIMNKVNKLEKVLVPEGTYELVIEKVDFGFTQKKDGQRVLLEFTITNDPNYNGCIIQAVYTIDNPNNTSAEEKSLQLFNDLLHSAGITSEQRKNFDTDFLLQKKVKAFVVIEHSKENQYDYNKIKKYC